MTASSPPETHGPDVARFSTVDEVDRPQTLIEFLDVAKALPGIRAAKEEILQRLEPGRASTALDVGCGYGADVAELASRLRPGGRATGVDISESMLAEATRRTAGTGLNVEFLKADALALPFEDDTFEIARVETVLQHTAEPERAVSEMARVTRPGGRIAALELDLATVFVDHADAELWHIIHAAVMDAAVQDSIGRRLPRLFSEAGVTEVDAAPRVITTGPAFFRLVLGRDVSKLQQAGVIGLERAESWWTAMDEAVAAGHFSGGGTAFVVSGTVR